MRSFTNMYSLKETRTLSILRTSLRFLVYKMFSLDYAFSLASAETKSF